MLSTSTLNGPTNGASPTPSSSSAPNGNNHPSNASSAKQQQQQQQHRRSPPSDAQHSSRKRSSSRTPGSPVKLGGSPTKQPTTPKGNGSQSAPSSATPSRASITNLVNATDEPPRLDASPTPGKRSGGAQADGDVVMHDEDDEEAKKAEMDVDVDLDEQAEEDEEAEEGEEGSEEEEEEEEDDEEDSEEDDESDNDDIVLLDPEGEPEKARAASLAVKDEPEDSETPAEGSAAPPEGGEEAVNVLQPKKKKRARRSPSSDEDLPPPPPPLPTIRLEVDLPVPVDKDPVILDWNFIEHAALAGIPVLNAWGEAPALGDPFGDPRELQTGGDATPMTEGAADTPLGPPPPGMSEADAERREMEAIAARLEAKYDAPGKKKVSKKRRVVDYDLNDPFIDDSDLGIDAPTHIARPLKEGFYVHSGQLDLIHLSPAEKSKKAKVNRAKKEGREPRQTLSAAVRARVRAQAGVSANEAIEIDSDDDAGPSVKYLPRSPSPPGDVDNNINRSLYKNAARDDKYLPPFNDFPDEVAHYLRALRRASLAQKWDPANKGRFPENLKGPLQKAGEAAFHHDLLCIVEKEQTDGNFEKYQEKAFVAALCSCLPYNRLTLGKLVLKLCYNDYFRWLQACEHEGLRQWKELLEPEHEVMLQEFTRAKAEHEAKQEEPELIEEDTKKDSGPKRNPVFTLDMRDIFRQLVENTQEMVDVNKKMEEWGQPIKGQSSELNMRKSLYNKIIALYPPEFMTTLTLSRAYTNYKRSGQSKQQQQE